MTLNGNIALLVGFSLCVAATAVMIIRTYCRYFVMGKIASFDYVMITAVLFAWGNFVLNWYIFHFAGEVPHGGPQHMRPSEFRRVFDSTLVVWYLYRIFYVLNLGIVKLSIVLFYYRLAVHRAFRYAVHCTLALVGLSTLIMLAICLVSCANPSDAWSLKVLLKYLSGHPVDSCLDNNKIWLAQAGLNLATDVIIFVLPMPTLLSTKLPPMKKLVLVSVFSVGIMAIVASCIRVYIISLWAKTPTSEAVHTADMLAWGQVEINSGIISASIPFLRPILRFPPKYDPSKDPEPKPAPSPSPRKVDDIDF